MFDLLALHTLCLHESDYGHKKGTPCVLLKLNKINNWIPPPFTDESVPADARDNMDNGHITVKFHAERDSDIENIGPINYYPKQGTSGGVMVSMLD